MNKKYYLLTFFIFLIFLPLVLDNSLNIQASTGATYSNDNSISAKSSSNVFLHTLATYIYDEINFTNQKTLFTFGNGETTESVSLEIGGATQYLDNFNILNGSEFNDMTYNGTTGWKTTNPKIELTGGYLYNHTTTNITDTVSITKVQSFTPDPELFSMTGFNIISGDNDSVATDDLDYLRLQSTSGFATVEFKLNLTKHGINWTDVVSVGFETISNTSLASGEYGWVYLFGSDWTQYPRQQTTGFTDYALGTEWNVDIEPTPSPVFFSLKPHFQYDTYPKSSDRFVYSVINPDDTLYLLFLIEPNNRQLTIDLVNFSVLYYERVPSTNTGTFLEVKETYSNSKPDISSDYEYHFISTQFPLEQGRKLSSVDKLIFQGSLYFPNDTMYSPIRNQTTFTRDVGFILPFETDNLSYPKLFVLVNFSTQFSTPFNITQAIAGFGVVVGVELDGITFNNWIHFNIDVLEYVKDILGYVPKITGLSNEIFNFGGMYYQRGLNVFITSNNYDQGIVGSRRVYIDNIFLNITGNDDLILGNEFEYFSYPYTNPKPYVNLTFGGVGLENVTADYFGTKTYTAERSLEISGDFNISANSSYQIRVLDVTIKVKIKVGISSSFAEGINQITFTAPPTGEYEIPDVAFTWQLSKKPDIVQIIEDGASHIAGEGYWNYTGGTLTIYGKSFIADTISSHGSVKVITIKVYYSSSDLKVSVGDSYGTPLEGIFVIARHHELGDLSFSITTNVNGIAFFQNIPNGRYDVITRKANEVALYTNFLLRDTGFIPLQISIVYLQWWQIITLMVAISVGSIIGTYLFSLYGKKGKTEETKIGKKKRVKTPFPMELKNNVPYMRDEKQQKKKDQEWFK